MPKRKHSSSPNPSTHTSPKRARPSSSVSASQGPSPSLSPSKSAHQSDPYPSLTSKSLRMSYRIARGEQGVLTFEPYKSQLLPLWRFKNPPIARESSSALWERFLAYDAAGDFVGMDMTRKFIQMGMTRAKRYANHKGGRKYKVSEKDGGGRGKSEVLEGGKDFEGREEKEIASGIFREIWERCKAHEGYLGKMDAFLEEQKKWDRLERKYTKNG